MKGKIRGQLTRTPDQRNPPGKPLAGNSSEEEEVIPPLSHQDQPRASSRINDNYCVAKLQTRLRAGSIPQTINTGLNLNVKLPVASHVHSAPGHSQKRELSPGSAGCHYKNCKLKSVKSVSCVTQLFCVQPVTNVKNTAPNLPVGARLQNFWQTWLDLGAGPKVVHILKEGYTLPFQIRPRLTRLPTVVSCYVNPHRNSYLLETLHQLSQKCGRTSKTPNFSGVFQQTIFNPKTQQQVATYSRSEQTESLPQGREIQNGDTGNHQDIPPTRGVGHLNRFQGRLLPYTNTGTVQEISEISCPRSDIPVQGPAFWSVHSTLEFTVIAKEVKLMAIHRGIRIHQYLDDWLVRATSHQACLQHTPSLVKICQKLGWLVNLDKSELDPKQIFDFVGYQFNLRAGWVRPTPDRWPNLQDKILEIMSLPNCPVRQFMSLIGLLTATENQVHLGRLHETHTVASQTTLENTRVTRKSDSNSQLPGGYKKTMFSQANHYTQ